MLTIALLFALTAAIGVVQSSMAATSVYQQGFEENTNGWLDSDTGWVGSVERVQSGDNDITSSSGDWHAVMDGPYGPFSRFDGYREVWPGDYKTEIDVYLNTSWDVGTGFDYAVASNGSDNAHQRDFIFHVGVVDDEGLLVNGSNNADFTTNSFKLLNDNGGNYFVVEQSGWYTLQHSFRDDGGILAVDLNLVKDGEVLWTATRTSVDDTIPGEVGGNRYAWFTHIDVVGGIAVDNHELFLTVDPAEKNDCKKGGWADFGFKNQGQCVRFVNTGQDSR